MSLGRQAGRQAAAAEAGLHASSADPGVVPAGFGQQLDVGAGGLTDLDHGFDEGDLRGEEGVRGGLHQLGGGQVGDDHPRARLDDLAVCVADHGFGPGVLAGEAEDDPVGVKSVLDCVGLPEKLGVPADLDLVAGGSELAQDVDHLWGGAVRSSGICLVCELDRDVH